MCTCLKIDLNDEQVLKSFEQLITSQSFKMFELKSCQLQVSFLNLVVFSFVMILHKPLLIIFMWWSLNPCSFFSYAAFQRLSIFIIRGTFSLRFLNPLYNSFAFLLSSYFFIFFQYPTQPHRQKSCFSTLHLFLLLRSSHSVELFYSRKFHSLVSISRKFSYFFVTYTMLLSVSTLRFKMVQVARVDLDDFFF